MKGALLVLSAASSVAAQITLQAFPDVVAAINPNDPEYTACSAAQVLLEDCINAAGGTDAALTADPTALVQCACCVEETPISPVFSVCSTYLEEEAPAYSTQASAYGDLYSICGFSADCGSGGSGGGNTRTPRTSESLPTETEAPTKSTESAESTESTESANSDTITSASVEQTYATACVDMIAIFTSCTNKIDGFTELPNSDRASCYCCQTNFNGKVQWTDELDQYASTCEQWAKTGEPDTAYSVAQTFASFCENFTDACDGATATTDSGETTSTNDVNAQGTTGSGSGNGGNGGGVTVTVTPTASQTGNAAAGLHIGIAGAVAAVVLAL